MFRISNSSRRSIGIQSSKLNFGLSQRFISFRLPNIQSLETVKSQQSDFEGLFSNNSVNELWFKRGQSLVDGLNQSLEHSNVNSSGTEVPNNLTDLISSTIQKPEYYGIYCYSSLLYNLQFFVENLRPSETTIHKVDQADPNALLANPVFEFVNQPQDEDLKRWIIDSFGSVIEFRTLLLNSAKGIKGDGITWLVAESNNSQSTINNNFQGGKASREPQYVNLKVINTYNTGFVDDSIRSGQVNRLRQQKSARLAALRSKQLERQEKENNEKDSTTTTTTTTESTTTSEEKTIISEIEEIDEKIDELTLGSTEDADLNTLYNDKKLLPLLAIDSSPRNYLLDYGVFGKQNYLDNVWECIDWDVVAKRTPTRTQAIIGSLYM
ncbi:Manganese/iron superoxide dismutase [Scheffersomyces coipomensis]|uniref:Manganese/iron superoxide dismutase n=1 Tax=Scheffersomyces coipomensis TaxID=1788519 RepID=UPI00315CCACE